VDFPGRRRGDGAQASGSAQAVEVAVSGALAPVRVPPEQGRAIRVEPEVRARRVRPTDSEAATVAPPSGRAADTPAH